MASNPSMRPLHRKGSTQRFVVTAVFRMRSDKQLLDRLRKLLASRGYLTRRVINGRGDVPTASTYRYRLDQDHPMFVDSCRVFPAGALCDAPPPSSTLPQSR